MIAYRIKPIEGFALCGLMLLAAMGEGLCENNFVKGGARAIAMGSAYSALSGDPNSLIYNPSGITNMDQMQLSAAYGRLYPGLSDSSNISLLHIRR